jgi:DNA-directed RNA polymerase subunit RPC12/RpoP
MTRREEPITWIPNPRDPDAKLWVRCLRCDHRWFPNASRWTHKDTSKKRKVVRCPKCRHRNKLPRAVVNFLINQAKKEMEWGFEKPEKDL